MTILLTIIVTYCLLSLSEWGIHKYLMHRRSYFPVLFIDHTIFHHHNYAENFSQCKYESLKHKSMRFDLLFDFAILSLPLFFLTLFFPVTGITVIIAVFLYQVIWNFLHTEMHQPRYNLKRFALYRFYCDYHHNHHVNPRTNFNVIALGADFLFGTYHRGS